MGFTHLHVHTEYSLLDGASRIKELVSRAKELNMKSLAITDHGVMFGVVDFWRECEKNGINGIIGCEVYTAKRKLTDKDAELDKGYGHLILLAENNEGYKNLTKIVSKGFTEGFYYKPRIDKEVLREHSKGIICLSACLAGDVQRSLMNNDYKGARQHALDFIDIFGKDNFFLEIQDQGIKEQYDILPMMKELSEELNIPLVATNDVHYVNREDAKVHDVLLCIQTGTRIDDKDRMMFPNDEFYLKSEEEMRQVFTHTPDAVDNTQLIAERCRVEIDFGTLKLPNFEAPSGLTNKEYISRLCYQGLEQRYENIDDELKQRLEYELAIIEEMGYIEYFLIVWDFIKYAKERDISVGPGRGSAAGSLVSYTLGITDIDPIKYNLIFERFLNPERVSMPDIDIDFCYERRQEVIDYVVEKYGKDKVSQIITFGTMKAKAAIRDVGRAINVSYSKTDEIAKAVPNSLGMTIEKAMQINQELKSMYENDEEVRAVIDTAKAIEGMPRHASTHAAGVVISKDRLDDFVPLYLGDKGVSTQFPMTTIEELGLLKMDFLGLRNLTVIRDAKKMILENHGVDVEFKDNSYDDMKVYEMISKGNTQGIFQLESSGMTQFMKNLKPDCFEDIVAGISLYRPGPMGSIPTYIDNKKNPSKVTYLHPKLEEILSVTYGCLVYQEQVMQIVRDLAGYTYGRSDILRRAMGKKKMDVMLAEEEQFVAGCVERNIDEAVAKAIFNQMVTFAEYGFNKSHAVGYAALGYETAYLKVHYPQEYMAALMTSVINDGSQIAKYIRNCKEMGIEVLPPSINKSKKHFTIEDGKIRFGLLAIKNVGDAVIDSIVKTREEKGEYKNIFDFVEKQDTSKMNKKAFASLIRAGSFDEINENRASLMAVHERLLDNAHKKSKSSVVGQISLFEINEDVARDENLENSLPNIPNFSKKDLIYMEKEMMGVYVTGHPLQEYEKEILEIATMNKDMLSKAQEELLQDLTPQIKNKDKGIFCGIITNKKKLLTKKNQMMAFLTIEDLFGSMEVVVFPRQYERYAEIIEEDRIVVIGGEVAFEDEREPKILANFILDLENFDYENRDYTSMVNQIKYGIENEHISREKKGKSLEDILDNFEKEAEEGKIFRDSIKEPLKIRILPDIEVSKVLDILREYKGDAPVYIYQGKKVMKADRNYWVSKDENLIERLGNLVGKENVKF